MGSAESYMGHVFVEGSSTAAGYGDEEWHFGYAGRLRRNFAEGYNYRSEAERSPCLSVIVHINGMPENRLPFYVRSFPANVARGTAPFTAFHARKVGIFLLNSAVSSLAMKRFDTTEDFRVSWRNALENLQQHCDEQRVEPVLLTGPAPDRFMRFRNGSVPHRETSDAVTWLYRRAAHSMEAPLLVFEELVEQAGYEKSDCMAPDTIHPNALGHSIMALGLAPFINERLGIPEEFGTFPDLLGSRAS